MRIKKTEVVEREGFVIDLFKQNPGLTGTKANEAIAAKFGGRKMRAKRLYELRKQATAPAAPVAPDPAPVAA